MDRRRQRKMERDQDIEKDIQEQEKITLIEGGRRREGGAGGLTDDRKGRGLKHVSSFKL